MQTVFIFQRKQTRSRDAQNVLVYDINGLTMTDYLSPATDETTLVHEATSLLRRTVTWFDSRAFNAVVIPVSSAKLDQIKHAASATSY